jgi:hypothetical protein
MVEGSDKYKKDFIFLGAMIVFFMFSFLGYNGFFCFLSSIFLICEMGYILVKLC